MKHLVILLTIVSSVVYAQSVQVLDTRPIQANTQNAQLFPSFTSDGNYLLYTTDGYAGLWIYDLATNTSRKVTETAGAGYHPISTQDGRIIYRQDEYVNNLKYTSYVSLNPQTKEETRISNPGRFVSKPSVSGNKLHFLENSQLKLKPLTSQGQPASKATDIMLLNDKLKIFLIISGEMTELAPRGEGNYIWSELSPTKDKILFTKTGDGTYVCDLDGNILTQLGHANAPRWSDDGRFILFMKDHDDGVQFTSSEIWISSSDGMQSWQITDTPDKIEMYPQWSPDNSEIVYHTLDGNIYLTTISIED